MNTLPVNYAGASAPADFPTHMECMRRLQRMGWGIHWNQHGVMVGPGKGHMMDVRHRFDSLAALGEWLVHHA